MVSTSFSQCSCCEIDINFIALDEYIFSPTTVEFILNDTRQCVGVVILDDNQREINEQFQLNLILLSVDDSSYMLTGTTITINDNERKGHLNSLPNCWANCILS